VSSQKIIDGGAAAFLGVLPNRKEDRRSRKRPPEAVTRLFHHSLHDGSMSVIA
jgi:hypothetical protein